MATLIGTSCGDNASDPKAPCVQGVIDWYGLVDLEEQGGQNEAAYAGCEIAKCPPDLLRKANPLTYIDSKDPPFLIQHGAADSTVLPKQSQKLYDALRAAGVPAEIVMYPNVAHGFAKVPGGGADDAVNQQALNKVLEFLERRFN
jgi:dipeptidyl aminopeptidase/acylaminoacyl peptidase